MGQTEFWPNTVASIPFRHGYASWHGQCSHTNAELIATGSGGETTAMKDFRIEHEMRGAVELVHLTGSLDLDTLPRLEEQFAIMAKQIHYAVLLDCEDLCFISISGLAKLIGFVKLAREQGGDLKLVNVPEEIYKIIVLLGFVKVLPVYDAEEEALASFAHH
jgi:anti-sigma B factor antagonist